MKSSYRNIIAVAASLAALYGAPALAQEASHEKALAAYQQQDFATAYDAWLALADQGDREAQYALGVMYFKGEGRPVDVEQAMTWFGKAARAGHPTAMFNVGVAHWEGKGAPINHEIAVEWWEKAAQLGDAASQYNLGLAYYLGKGVKKDPERALYWVRQAEESGHENAAEVLPTIEEEYQKSIASQPAPSQPAEPVQPAPEPVPAQPQATPVVESSPQPAQPAQASSQAATPAASTETTGASESQSSGPPTTGDGHKAALVRADGITVHSAGQAGAPVIDTLPMDSAVKVVEVRNGWALVRKASGFNMWVFGKFVSGTSGAATITGSDVRARPMPSTSNESIPVGEFRKGDQVTIVDRKGDWIRVQAPEHLGGWVRVDQLLILDQVSPEWQQMWQSGAG